MGPGIAACVRASLNKGASIERRSTGPGASRVANWYPIEYYWPMLTVLETDGFTRWRKGLDKPTEVRVAIRLQRVELGNLGDHKPVGDSVIELRLDFGPGYRLYCIQHGPVVIVMLAGGDKSSQARDIRRAKALAKEYLS